MQLGVFPPIDVCAWFGHSPAVAARFYAQVRSETADRASREHTVSAATNGSESDSTAGAIHDEMGALNDSQEDSSTYQDGPEHQEKDRVLIGTGGASVAPEGMYQWTILDSNQRPPRCQRGALTN